MTAEITNWRKSTRSGNTANCVEVGTTMGTVAVRDTKHRTGPVLTFTPTDWAAFLDNLKEGTFDLA